MHDPMTQAFEIHGPRGLYYNWKRRQLMKRDQFSLSSDLPYPSPLVRVWHVDPELDGSDDSCGYSSPRLTKEERERVAKIAEGEFDFMFGKHDPLKRATVTEVIFAIWEMLAWRMERRRRLSLREINEIHSLASNPTDNLRYVVAEAKFNEQEFRRLWFLIYRCSKRVHRKWYQHPRWHVHHWHLQFPFAQKIKRSLFSRCGKCGRRFAWGESCVSKSWHSDGPRWFRSEQGVYHSGCA